MEKPVSWRWKNHMYGNTISIATACRIALPAVEGCEEWFISRNAEQDNIHLPIDIRSACAYHNLLHLTVLKKYFADFKCFEIGLNSVLKLPWTPASRERSPLEPPLVRCLWTERGGGGGSRPLDSLPCRQWSLQNSMAHPWKWVICVSRLLLYQLPNQILPGRRNSPLWVW